MTKQEILKHLDNGKLPRAKYDGSGRTLINADDGTSFLVKYRVWNGNDWKVMSFEEVPAK